MKKTTLILFLLFIISGCGVKQTQQLVSTGNYDEAINNALANLRTNKDKKGKLHQHIVECKYYQTNGKNAGVQVSLYVHSRMEDIFSYRKKFPEFDNYTFSAGVATNTRFSADAIAYGRLMLANPDLVERFRRGAPLNAPDYDLLYTGEEKGYTDYPAL